MSEIRGFLKKENSEKGFTIIEVLISLGLLTLVIGISMNVLSVVLRITEDADYSTISMQEAQYAAESVRRSVRSAESFRVVDEGEKLTVSLGGDNHTFEFDVADKSFLRDGKSVISSEVKVEQLDDIPFFGQIVNDEGELLGVKMAFKIVHVNDTDDMSGALYYVQALNRNQIMNK